MSSADQYLEVAEVLPDQYIFCVGNYDLCELGRRRRLEIGCFFQLVPVLLITG